ncbi:MAG: hypothetical protein IID41_06520 [Planctomycetes bacterium]|nr:hypothetical protein [Planctomycetota bacterium]
MPTKTLKCMKCDKTFSRPGPFAWHMQSMHGAKKKTKVAKKAKKLGKKRTMKRAGRPKGAVGRMGLKTMSLEQLVGLIEVARDEARSRIAEIEASIG